MIAKQIIIIKDKTKTKAKTKTILDMEVEASISSSSSATGSGVGAIIPLEEWIRRARSSIPSSEQYVEAAVGLALELTNCLCLITGTGGNNGNGIKQDNNNNNVPPSASLLHVQLKDIELENMLLHLTNKNDILSPIACVDINKSMTATASTDDKDTVNNNEVSAADLFDMPQITSRDVFPLLGKILFELFSKGHPLFYLQMMEAENNNESSSARNNAFCHSSSSSSQEEFKELMFENLFHDHYFTNPSSLLDCKNDVFIERRASFNIHNYYNPANNPPQQVGGGTAQNSNIIGKRSRSAVWGGGYPTKDLPELSLSFNKRSTTFVQELSSGISTNAKRSYSENDAMFTSTSNSNHSKAAFTDSLPYKAKRFLQQECGLPISVCRLISDLLEAGGGSGRGNNNSQVLNKVDAQFLSDSAADMSLQEAQTDLSQMKSHPSRFLHDRTCPTKASEDLNLFHNVADGNLYGREAELSTLSEIAQRVSSHVLPSSSPSPSSASPSSSPTNEIFLCEAAFVAGHSGSGKSSICNRLISTHCCSGSSGSDHGWLLLTCKFDRQVAPLLVVQRAFNDFFDTILAPARGSSDGDGDDMDPSHKQIAQHILSSLDLEGLRLVCELMPVFHRLLPEEWAVHCRGSIPTSSSSVNVGSGRYRLHSLFCLLLKSIIRAGHPVLIFFDDLQWSDSLALNVIADIVTYYQSPILMSKNDKVQGGLFLLGSYRDNEIDKNILLQIRFLEQMMGNVNVTKLNIGKLSLQDINEMISFKLGQPIRTTKQLSELIFQKTRGLPIFVAAFLRSIVSRDILYFSVKSRKWEWDDEVLDFLTISEDVAEFLAHNLNCLGKELVDAMKVCSCIGFQINEIVIPPLDLGQFVPDLDNLIRLALKEGLMERAGPIYAFSHDMLRESAYNLIPLDERKDLHKRIGISLAHSANISSNADLCIIAVDQINVCKDILNPIERSLFAKLNLAAGKHSFAASSYEQARGYFEAGINLLHALPWEKQYTLCLELYEMSAIVGFVDGDVEHASSRLDVILSNVNIPTDKLKAQGLYMKMIASRGEYAEATNQCLEILSQFGLQFPKDIELSKVANEINRTKELLKDVTKDQILRLPKMTENPKNCMKILNLMCDWALFERPMLCNLASCAMVKLTMKHGYCEDSIDGIARLSRAILYGIADIQTADRIGSLALSFLGDCSNNHALRIRLTVPVNAGVKFFTQPWQICGESCRMGYDSGMIVGEIDRATTCVQAGCSAQFYAGTELTMLQLKLNNYIHQLVE